MILVLLSKRYALDSDGIVWRRYPDQHWEQLSGSTLVLEPAEKKALRKARRRAKGKT